MSSRLDGARLAGELAELGQKWQRASRQLAALPEPPKGASPRERLERWDGVDLYHYSGTAKPANRTPLLVVYSLVNRPYILDFKPERSLLGALRDAGVEVHLLDWGYPDAADAFLNLDDYVNGYIGDAVDSLCRRYGVNQIHLLGVCQGGTLASCFAALHPGRVRSLVTLVTPIDFHAGAGTLYHLVKHLDFARVGADGNVRADLLNALFVGLKPYRLLSQRYMEMLEIGEDSQAMSDFLHMEQWMYDSPDQAGEAFAEFAKNFYQDNGLVNGTICLGGRRVELARIDMPVYNIYATADHLVPPASALALGDQVSSRDYRPQAFDSGHLGMFVSARARKSLFPAIADWLRERDVAG